VPAAAAWLRPNRQSLAWIVQPLTKKLSVGGILRSVLDQKLT
jgi:hypothetical protein